MSDINVATTNMARDASNNIHSEPKFMARITHKLNNGVRRNAANLLHKNVFIDTKMRTSLVWAADLPKHRIGSPNTLGQHRSKAEGSSPGELMCSAGA
jgi:hypothetical protein